MIDQFQKYKDNKDVKIIACTFHGDNRAYSYLTDFDVEVGDTVVARMKDGEMKCLKVTNVQDSSHIMPNPPFKKYGWVVGGFSQDTILDYAHRDDDIGAIPNSIEKSAVAVPKVEPPKDDTEDRMKAIFG
jgi:hypothetical protein